MFLLHPVMHIQLYWSSYIKLHQCLCLYNACFSAAKDQSMAVVVEFNFSSTVWLRLIMCLHENKLTCIEMSRL